VERLRFFCSPPSDSAQDIPPQTILYYPTFTAVYIMNHAGASGLITVKDFVNYSKRFSVSGLDKEKQLVLKEPLSGIVSAVLTADGNLIKEAINNSISEGRSTLFAVNITNDKNILDGMESSVIWLFFCGMNGTLALLCLIYVAKIAKLHYNHPRKKITLDFCIIALIYGSIGNILAICNSIDPFGLNNILPTVTALMCYLGHVALTVASFSTCLFYWQEAVTHIGNSLHMKISSPQVWPRAMFLALMTAFIAVDKRLLTMSSEGAFPIDIVSALLLIYSCVLSLLVVYLVKVAWSINKVIAKISRKVAVDSQSPTPAILAAKDKISSSTAEVGTDSKVVSGGGTGAGAMKLVIRNNKIDSTRARSDILEGFKAKLIRCIHIKRQNMWGLILLLVTLFVFVSKLYVSSIALYTVCVQGITTIMIYIQITSLRTIVVAMESSEDTKGRTQSSQVQ
jgi:hypothetical protein